MPNYVTFTDRKTGQPFMGRDLIQIDERMCAELGVQCDEKNFYCFWVDWTVFYVQNGWENVRKAISESKNPTWEEPRVQQILDWLEENFTQSAGYMAR
jgi:hypothetical protein